MSRILLLATAAAAALLVRLQPIECFVSGSSLSRQHQQQHEISALNMAESGRLVGATKTKTTSISPWPFSSPISSSSSNVMMSDLRSHMLRSVPTAHLSDIGRKLAQETLEVANCVSLATLTLWTKDSSVTPQDIVLVCDEIDELAVGESSNPATATTTTNPSLSLLFVNAQWHLRRKALEFRRHELLVKLLRQNYQAYVATASFLSPNRIPREQLPNVEDIPYPVAIATATKKKESSASSSSFEATGGAQQQQLMVPENNYQLDDDEEYEEDDYWLDSWLLNKVRALVEQHTGGEFRSDAEGILGLLDQCRQFTLQPNMTPQAQHRMVYDTLQRLLASTTPLFLPLLYRIFFSGRLPKKENHVNNSNDNDHKPIQLGPWFYAPYLTSLVAPTLIKFWVGPSKPNRRRDGKLGGVLVQKCKFLQESKCQGLCRNQCQIPTQQFFAQELGVPLTVSPNFATHECQWSFGQVPAPLLEQ